MNKRQKAKPKIPQPPDGLVNGFDERFEPSAEMAEWIVDTFISETGRLRNIDHAHLATARLGVLWTNVANSRRGRDIIASAETGKPQGAMGKWNRARAEMQVVDWFGMIPDFVITIHAAWWSQASDVSRCAVVEHELFHCAQDTDAFGAPKFNRQTGRPSFTIRGHDCEEFVGVVRRYGIVSEGVRALVEAAGKAPEVADVDIRAACGACR